MKKIIYKTAKELEQDFLNYLENTDYPNLYRAVYYLGEVDFYNLYKYTKDFYTPNNGSVRGLIYYKDTEPFARYFFDEIDNLLNDLGDSKRYSQNNMTWITWEAMMWQLDNFKEENEENKIYLIDKD